MEIVLDTNPMNPLFDVDLLFSPDGSRTKLISGCTLVWTPGKIVLKSPDGRNIAFAFSRTLTDFAVIDEATLPNPTASGYIIRRAEITAGLARLKCKVISREVLSAFASPKIEIKFF